MSRRMLSFLTLFAVLMPVMSAAQGVQTGTLRGTVTSSDGMPSAEAAVTVASPALQGERATATDVNGVYVLAKLPPGCVHDSHRERQHDAGSSCRRSCRSAASSRLDATLSVAAVSESVVVEGVRPPAVTEIQTSANIRASEVNVLPMGRTPYLIAELMPGVTTNTPSANQITISGGFAYDNVFLIDGVDVNDNLLGTVERSLHRGRHRRSAGAHLGHLGRIRPLLRRRREHHHEERRQHAVAAATGRTFSRPSWTNETPFERANGIERGKPTAANPFVTNKLSHFSEAQRRADRPSRIVSGSSAPAASRTRRRRARLQVTAIPYTKTNNSKRYEAKATGAVARATRCRARSSTTACIAPTSRCCRSASTRRRSSRRRRRTDSAVVNYNGALSPRMLLVGAVLAEALLDGRRGRHVHAIVDSPFLTRSGTQYQYNAPFFDASDPEQRNNRQLTASLSYFRRTAAPAATKLKGGVEHFVDTRIGANAQTSTGYVFLAELQDGRCGCADARCRRPADSSVRPGVSRLERWIPHRGAEFNLTTLSAYVQDHWVVSPNLTFNLGMRFEHASSEDTGGSDSVNSSRVVPRLGASYAFGGDGSMVLQTSFSQILGQVQRAAVLEEHDRGQFRSLHHGLYGSDR